MQKAEISIFGRNELELDWLGLFFHQIKGLQTQ